MHNTMQTKMTNAVKWSILAECAAKLITPFTSMILARILDPEEYGILAVITMIISFADMFTDAGFQKFLVQHKFKHEEKLKSYATVAFWTNLSVSIILWLCISMFSHFIANVMNIEGKELAIIVASFKLILTAFSSIQRALYQRRFDYKTIFYIRIICCFIPVIITIPLALLGVGYWALIIGTLVNEAAYAVVLTLHSSWKPCFFYSIKILKKMLSFSIWSLIEQISIWLTSYVDTIIVSLFLSSYYLGIYKQPENMIISIYSIFTSSVFIILFSALSRCNDNNDVKSFQNIFLSTQFGIALLILPMSIGIFCYRELVTNILLGSQWYDSQIVIGLVAISQGIQLILNNPASEVYRAKGEPKVSVFAQFVYTGIYVIILTIGVKFDFNVFVSVRAASVLIFTCIHYIILKKRYNFSFYEIIKNILIPLISSLCMGVVSQALEIFANGQILFEILGILISIVLYGFIICSFSRSRLIVISFLEKVKKKKIVGYIACLLLFIINNLWKEPYMNFTND